MRGKNKELIGWGLPLLLVVLFFLPLLAGWGRFFFDDIAFLFYPQQQYLSSLMESGQFPLWDPAVCAGATPFYTRIFSSAYYPINWLFLFLGSGSFSLLITLPLSLHYLFSASFAYLLARKGLGFTRPGSGVMSLVYTLSPSMIYMSTFPPEIFVQSWLPLMILLSLIFSRTGRLVYLILGSLIFGLLFSAGDIPFVSHVIFLWGISILAWVFRSLFCRRVREALRVLIGSAVMALTGILLLGVYTANIVQGISLLGIDSASVIGNLCTVRQSIHPLYLITSFLPDYFGGVASIHPWGAAYETHCSLNDGNILGGLALFLLIILAAFRFRRPAHPGWSIPPLRGLYVFFSLITLLGIILILGPYLPFYGLLKKINPYFGMPYPLRYRIIQCFGMAGLAGVSASIIWQNPLRPRPRRLFIYLGLVLSLFLLGLFWVYRIDKGESLSGFSQLTFFKDWGWFVSTVGGYFVSISILLVVFSVFMKKIFGRMLVGLVVAEILFFAAQGFYQNRIFNHRIVDFTADRYSNPFDHPEYQKVAWFHQVCPDIDQNYRRAYYRSCLDNLAWIFGTDSILGVDVKPMIPSYSELMGELAPGYPYELRPRDWTRPFWRNMSVGGFLTEQKINHPDVIFRGRRANLYAYEYSSACPRVYFQDRWASGDREKERLALLDYDLRHVGYLPAEIWALRPLGDIYPEQEELSLEEGIKRFEMFQKDNPLERLDFSSPNRIEIQILTETPGMLVLTDVWHPDWRATVNGHGEPIHQVNYLQRGIWLCPGRNRVVMEFIPSSLGPGLALSFLGLLLLGVLVSLSWRQYRKSGSSR